MAEKSKSAYDPDVHPINSLMTTTLAKLKEMVDVDIIVGKPIDTPDGTTLIPVSRLSMGFGSGGSDFAGKNHKDNTPYNFGGGSGAGVKIDPVAFLIVKDGSVRILPIGIPAASPAARAVEMVPQLVDKVTDYLDRQKDKKDKSDL